MRTPATPLADASCLPYLAGGPITGVNLPQPCSFAVFMSLTSWSGSFSFSFRERKNLGDVQRLFESSTNLVNWVEVTPSSLVTIGNLQDVYLRAAVFPVQDQASFFRLKFLLPTSP